MACLDVYPTPGKAPIGYVVEVQADLLSQLTTRVVVPLIPEARLRVAAADLNPVFEIGGERHVMVTQAIGTVPRRELRRAVGSLGAHRELILRALDLLLTGV